MNMQGREAFEKAYADAHDLPLETFQQYRLGDSYRLPIIAKCWRFWNMGIGTIVVELPLMNPGAGRLVTTLAKSMHTQYVKAIEAAGAKVAQ